MDRSRGGLKSGIENLELIGGFMNVTFMAEDVEATAKEMKARGVEFVQEPQKADWGTAAIFRDVDGNQFVLSTP